MECPRCRFENPLGSGFCLQCGGKLEVYCPACENPLPLGAKFCNQCGHEVAASKESTTIDFSTTQFDTPKHLSDKLRTRNSVEGERKHVTVLFSDLSGYTAMSEKLDPEEVKEITVRIFGEVSKIVSNYDGSLLSQRLIVFIW